jgi:SAM-dependent methyltransferase
MTMSIPADSQKPTPSAEVHVQKGFYESFWTDEAQAEYDPHILDGDPRQGLRILSLGCGTGKDLWHLVREHEVHGIELSSSGARVAREHGIEAVVGSVLQPFPFDDATFDIVVAKDIVEHVEDPLFVLREAARVLKPDGRILILVPNHFYIWARLRMLFGAGIVWKSFLHDHTQVFEEWNYIHVRFFTWRGLQRLLGAAGLRITRRYLDFGCLEHYFVPERVAASYRAAWERGTPRTKRGLLVCYVLYPLARLLDVVLPRRARCAIVSRAPGLLTASFYLRCAVGEPAQEPSRLP